MYIFVVCLYPFPLGNGRHVFSKHEIHLVMNAVVNVSVDANILKMSLFRRFSGSHRSVPV